VRAVRKIAFFVDADIEIVQRAGELAMDWFQDQSCEDFAFVGGGPRAHEGCDIGRLFVGGF